MFVSLTAVVVLFIIFHLVHFFPVLSATNIIYYTVKVPYKFICKTITFLYICSSKAYLSFTLQQHFKIVAHIYILC